VLVEIDAAGAIGCILCGQIFAGNGLVAEQRLLMSQQRGSQNRELLVGLQAAKALLGLQHCGSSPSQRHPRIAPTFDMIGYNHGECPPDDVIVKTKNRESGVHFAL
jgi:hypothetical protein